MGKQVPRFPFSAVLETLASLALTRDVYLIPRLPLSSNAFQRRIYYRPFDSLFPFLGALVFSTYLGHVIGRHGEIIDDWAGLLARKLRRLIANSKIATSEAEK